MRIFFPMAGGDTIPTDILTKTNYKQYTDLGLHDVELDAVELSRQTEIDIKDERDEIYTALGMRPRDRIETIAPAVANDDLVIENGTVYLIELLKLHEMSLQSVQFATGTTTSVGATLIAAGLYKLVAGQAELLAKTSPDPTGRFSTANQMQTFQFAESATLPRALVADQFLPRLAIGLIAIGQTQNATLRGRDLGPFADAQSGTWELSAQTDLPLTIDLSALTISTKQLWGAAK